MTAVNYEYTIIAGGVSPNAPSTGEAPAIGSFSITAGPAIDASQTPFVRCINPGDSITFQLPAADTTLQMVEFQIWYSSSVLGAGSLFSDFASGAKLYSQSATPSFVGNIAANALPARWKIWAKITYVPAGQTSSVTLYLPDPEVEVGTGAR